ncbi:type II toxin-antitoxin system antitoxin DNA ADP-ribosyl glycohydrolase DarG [Runella zeae]|uniref:type II toxin-antitoxin system antitoxin DNA ADP-ribosyl glycohydrolase DarG n=1 Tax=Runella zeae TaxID=94255 RepID=UPI0003F9FD71|nr:macro domain-containing protein [Runella zeae]
MIKYIKGNLLQAKTHALVNTVNTVGVMGKGIALQFKEQFPANFKAYSYACKNGKIGIGKLFVFEENTLEGKKIIINFPTKTEWYKKSQYSYIEEGLKDLVKIIEEYKLESIALPPLGCGNGGLDWGKVKALIENYLANLSIEIIVYEPNDAVKEALQKEGQKKEINLTPARAMLLYALAKYEERGENPSVFAANKLAYFLQESGEPLKLQFVAYTFGPYAQAVEKVLYALNGKYLTGLEQMNAKPFEPLNLEYSKFNEVEDFVKQKLTTAQKERLKSVLSIIEGFESTLSLEILSSIHFLLKQDKTLTQTDLLEKIHSWNDRKRDIIKEKYINLAFDHLQNYAKKLSFT